MREIIMEIRKVNIKGRRKKDKSQKKIEKER